MAITIVLTRVMKLIARPLHVPITSFSATVEQIERQNASTNHSFAMARKIVKTEAMKIWVARQIHVLLWAANTNANRL